MDGYADKENGGETVYIDNEVRQDIFIKGYIGKNGEEAKAAESVVVTGALTKPNNSDDGWIWVWAETPEDENEENHIEENHYEMLKQFARFTSTSIDDDTLHAFRNAQDDEVTGCGGDYLTGQEGEVAGYIYWTGGFDFVFRKIDGDGNPIGKATDGSDGATFTLYNAVKNAEGVLVPVKLNTKDTPADNLTAVELGNAGWNAYQQVNKTTKVKGDATSTSAKIEAANAVKVKSFIDAETKPEDILAYGDGLVEFEKIPPGNYFMVETVEPDPWKRLIDVYRVYVDGSGWISISAVETDENGKPVWPDAVNPTEPAEDFTTTFVKGSDDRYSWSEDVDGKEAKKFYNIMNASKLSRKVILKKVDGDKAPLNGAVFTVLYADKKTPVKIRDDKGAVVDTLEGKTSGASGAFWIGNLPFGTYYLNETKNVSGTAVDIWFILTVNENGVGYLKADAEEGEKPVNTLNPEKTKP